MTAKSYLFVAVSSTFFLFLVLPSAIDPSWLPTHIAVIVALSAISISAGGLASEVYDVVKNRSLLHPISTRAEKCVMTLGSSLLFLAIVAPAMRLYVEGWEIVGIATVIVLLILSIAVAGLASEGLFGILSLVIRRAARQATSHAESTSAMTEGQTNRKDQTIISHIDSSFKALDASQERRMRELKQQLIHELEGKSDLLKSQTMPEAKHNPSSKESSQVVDVLLGKSKVGAK